MSAVNVFWTITQTCILSRHCLLCAMRFINLFTTLYYDESDVTFRLYTQLQKLRNGEDVYEI